MVRPRDRELAGWLEAGLLAFTREAQPLPGIDDAARRETLVEQLVESVRRVKLVEVLRMRELSPRRSDPNDDLFDPLKAAILHTRDGNLEEAFWLVFLFVHFGKHTRAGWRYAREVYGRLGEGSRWDWAHVSADPSAFREWLQARQSKLKREGVPGGFGNHRKYESLDGNSANGTGAVVESYVRWVNPPRTHQELMQQTIRQADADARKAFDLLYQSMRAVTRFGRLARFDYLTMVAKLGLAAIEPGSTYLQSATGPLRGARLLFGGDENAATLDGWLTQLDAQLEVGMQVLEDALCNWQKSPAEFKPFRA